MARRGKDETGAESFLSRWSQRKQAAEEEIEQPSEGAATSGDGGAPQPDAPQDTASEINPDDLPDIETLEAGSDFSVFMKKGVPEALQRQALRKLWRLNPIFGYLDGLNDYDLDYTNAATVVENLKSIYQVGKGMVLPEEEAAEKAAAEAAEAAGSGENEGSEDAAADGEAAQVSADSEATTEATTEALPTSKTRTRKPGDPVVSGAATRRQSAARSGARSALRRRWGDGGS